MRFNEIFSKCNTYEFRTEEHYFGDLQYLHLQGRFEELQCLLQGRLGYLQCPHNQEGLETWSTSIRDVLETSASIIRDVLETSASIIRDVWETCCISVIKQSSFLNKEEKTGLWNVNISVPNWLGLLFSLRLKLKFYWAFWNFRVQRVFCVAASQN